MDLARDQRYTYSDYLTWGEDVHCELIYGAQVMMAPAPAWKHQEGLLKNQEIQEYPRIKSPYFGLFMAGALES